MKTSTRRGFAFRTSYLPYVVGGAVALVAVLVIGIRYGSSASGSSPSPSASEDLAALAFPASSAGALASAGPPLPTGAASLSDEIALVRPLLTDTSGPLDRGTASLALWASTKLTWADLKALPATGAALFRKDPDQERGRALCIEGTIQEIRAEKSLARRLVDDHPAPLVEAKENGVDARPLPAAGTEDRPDSGAAPLYLGEDDSQWLVPGGKVFIAVITEEQPHSKEEDPRRPRPLMVEAVAVKSTGALVDGSSAKFCGILTGVQQTVDQRVIHRAVGMFELPENTGSVAH